jgi:hypothetical protein
MLALHNAWKYIININSDKHNQYTKINTIMLGYRYPELCKVYNIPKSRIIFTNKNRIDVYLNVYNTYYKRLYLSIKKQGDQYRLTYVSCDYVDVDLNDKIAKLYFKSRPIRHYMYNVKTKETFHLTHGFVPNGRMLKYEFDEKNRLTTCKCCNYTDAGMVPIILYYVNDQINKITVGTSTYIKI